MELVRKVPLEKREKVPLFVNFIGLVWRHVPLTDLFKAMLLASGVPESDLFKYSMHSWRIYLACALLAAGASNGTIQAMLRWRSDEALKIYARINMEPYADNLARAGQAKVDSVRTTTLAEAMRAHGLVDGQQHAAYADAWLRQAYKAKVTAEHAKAIPTHSEHAFMQQVHAGVRNGSLVAAAAQLEDGWNED